MQKQTKPPGKFLLLINLFGGFLISLAGIVIMGEAIYFFQSGHHDAILLVGIIGCVPFALGIWIMVFILRTLGVLKTPPARPKTKQKPQKSINDYMKTLTVLIYVCFSLPLIGGLIYLFTGIYLWSSGIRAGMIPIVLSSIPLLIGLVLIVQAPHTLKIPKEKLEEMNAKYGNTPLDVENSAIQVPTRHNNTI